MAEGNIIITLTAKSDKFTADIGKARGALESMKASLNVIKFDAITNLGSAAINAAERVYNFGRTISSSLNDIQRQAAMLGMTTGKFQEFSYVAKMSDVNVEGFMTSMKMLANNIDAAKKGTGDAVDTFRQLGITTEDLTGKNSDFEIILKKILGSMSQYKDGIEKAAALNNMFGRSGYTMTQFVNQGVEGFDELVKKFREYGFEIEEGVLKKGSKVEDQFKNFETAWINLKSSATGYLVVLGDILEKLTEIAMLDRSKKGFGAPASLDPYSAAHYAKYAGVPSSIKSWVAPFEETKKDFPQGLNFQQIKSNLNESRSLYEEWKNWWSSLWDAVWSKEPSYEPYTDIWMKQEDERVKKFNLETLPEIETAFSKLLAEVNKLSTEGKLPSWEDALWQPIKKAIPDVNSLTLAFDMLLASVEKLSSEGKLADWAEGLDPLTPGKGFMRKDGLLLNIDKFEAQAKQMSDFWTGIATNMGQSLTSGFFNIFTDGLDNMGDAFKKFGENLLNSFTNIIQQLITNWLMFGSIMGASGFVSGQSYGGFLGLLGMGKGGAPGGGGVNAPMPGGGQAGAIYVTNNYIDAIDVQSIEDRLTGPVIRGMGGAKNRQAMKNIVRRSM